MTKHLLYLQLRHDILEDRLRCGDDSHITLAGLALQAEYGNYDGETMGDNYYTLEHYFTSRCVESLGRSFIRSKATESHEKAASMTEKQAQLEFIVVNLHF